MLSYVLRRLFLMVPTLLGVTVVVFSVMALSPGGVGANLMSEEGGMRPEERAALRKYYEQHYGLGRPWYVQYARWLNNVSPLGWRMDGEGRYAGFGFKTPDLGKSMVRNRAVLEVIADALPVTLLLNLITIPIIYGVAVSSGIVAAARRGALFDVGTGTLFIALWSLPTMWVGVTLIGYLANRDFIRFFPVGGMHDTLATQMTFLPVWAADGWQRGWLLDSLWHLVLPVACLTYGGFAFLSKLMRASVLENLSADFVRTARAKGVDSRTILFTHVLRNSVLPLITVAASIIPGLLGGSVIVESIFSLNGMGRLMIEAINTRDRDLVLSETLVVGIISLVCLLIADLLYAVADTRVSYE